LRQQVYLGDDAFVERMRARGTAEGMTTPDAARPHRAGLLSQPQPLSVWLASCPTREEALYGAYREGGLTMTAMARELGLSVARVSQLVKKGQGSGRG